jgi:TIR domain
LATYYLSSAVEDRGLAQELASHLEAAGADCFVPTRDAAVNGEPAGETTLRAFQAAPYLIALLTKHANASRFVLADLERAAASDKTIYCICMDGEKPSTRAELFVSSSQWVGASRRTLARAAEAIIAAARGEQLTKEFRYDPARAARRKLLPILLGASLMIVAGMAAAVAVYNPFAADTAAQAAGGVGQINASQYLNVNTMKIEGDYEVIFTVSSGIGNSFREAEIVLYDATKSGLPLWLDATSAVDKRAHEYFSVRTTNPSAPPKDVVACVGYWAGSSRHHAVQAFAVERSDMSMRPDHSYDIRHIGTGAEIGPKKVFADARSCADAAARYAAQM